LIFESRFYLLRQAAALAEENTGFDAQRALSWLQGVNDAADRCLESLDSLKRLEAAGAAATASRIAG